jgi:hypothetical protein
MVFVADDLAAWLVGMLADAGRKRLATWVLGSDQERALRRAATAAVQLTADDLRPDGGERAEELAMVVSQIFGEPLPEVPLSGQATLLEALQAGITRQLAAYRGMGRRQFRPVSASGPMIAGRAGRRACERTLVMRDR